MTKPNILIFMTDQQRAQTVFPEHPAKTPYLDIFHKEGIMFTQARCPSPHCCPSRATFFTGLYPSEHGVWHNVNVHNAISRGLNDGVRVWSDDLVKAGYTCSFHGKWHVNDDMGPEHYGWAVNGIEREANPQKDKKDYKQQLENDWEGRRQRAMNPAPTKREEGDIVRHGYGPYKHYLIDEDPFRDQDVVNSGLAALKELCKSDTPWCTYVGTLGPHDPYRVPQRFLDMYKDAPVELPESFRDAMQDKPGLYRRTKARFDQLSDEEHKQAIRHYWAFCSYEDWLFGQLLDELEASGQKENTVVIYCSDHGDYLGDHGIWCKGLPSFTGAYEIPFSIRWPAGLKNPGRRIDARIGLEDMAKTVLELSDNSALKDWPGSGRSLVPFIKDEGPSDWRSAHASQSNGNEQYGIQRSWDDGNWRFVFNGYDEDELYDLNNDPHQMINLARNPDYADQVAECYSKMWAFAYEHRDQCINEYIMTALAEYGPSTAFNRDGTPVASGG